MYDVGVLVAMLVCLITYAVYVQTLRDFQPQNTYEVYDSLGGAQAHVLLPKKVNPLTWNSKCCSKSKYLQLLCVFLAPDVDPPSLCYSYSLVHIFSPRLLIVFARWDSKLMYIPSHVFTFCPMSQLSFAIFIVPV